MPLFTTASPIAESGGALREAESALDSKEHVGLGDGAADGCRHGSITVGDVWDDNVKLVKAGADETGKRG